MLRSNFPKRFVCSAFLSLALSACFDAKKVWIVVELTMPDGSSASMAFNNPSVPDLTIKECEDSISAATPRLMEYIKKEPRLVDATYKSARCVASIDDPIKPLK